MNQLSIFDEQKSPQVRMHNNIVWARFPYLTESEMKIFLLMFAQLPWGVEEIPVTKIAVKDVIDYRSGKKYSLIKQACIALKKKFDSIEINKVVNGKKEFQLISAISFVSYREGNEYIEAKFNSDMKQFLISLQGNFTTVELIELFSLKTSGAIRLYIMIKSLVDNKIEYTDTVENIKKMFFNTDKKYDEYKAFKRDFLIKHQKALQDTFSAFEIIEHKRGKVVEKLTLKPLKKPEDRFDISPNVEKQLKSFNVNLAAVIKLIASNQVTEDYVNYVIQHTLSENKRNSSKKLNGGYILNCIKNKTLAEDYLKSSTPVLPIVESKPLPTTLTEDVYMTFEQIQTEYNRLPEKERSRQNLEGYIHRLSMQVGIVKRKDQNGNFFLIKQK